MKPDSVLFRRLAWNVVPVALVVGTLWTALAGEHGLMNRHQLRSRLADLEGEADALEESNRRLRAEVHALRTDPLAVQRAAAAVLLKAPDGSTIYRLDTP